MPNTTGSSKLRVTLSDQSIRLLIEIAEKGVYGRNPSEVAGRFIDKALQEFIDTPRLQIKNAKKQKSTESVK